MTVWVVTSSQVNVVLQVCLLPVASSTYTPACLIFGGILSRHSNGKRSDRFLFGGLIMLLFILRKCK